MRGLSRKVLSQTSGLSERYIAQLEGGQGNVSIILLRRVANAMGVRLDDLITGNDALPDWPVVRDLLSAGEPGADRRRQGRRSPAAAGPNRATGRAWR